MFSIIKMGRARGKTTEALKQLDAMGGGVFITNNPQEVAMLASRLELPNRNKIQVLNLKYSNVVIDDADGPANVIVTINEVKHDA